MTNDDRCLPSFLLSLFTLQPHQLYWGSLVFFVHLTGSFIPDMKKILLILLGCFWFSFLLFSQSTGMVTGFVTDSSTRQPLSGATIFINEHTGVTTDQSGAYFFKLTAGRHILFVRFIGYRPVSREIYLSPGDTLQVNFRMIVSKEILNEIVISAEKFSQELSEVNVSMSVLKPREIMLENAVSLDEILNKMSGINILDGQPSIRGGSGFSYGAGSRVLVVADGLPLMAGDAGDVKWDFLPLETLAKVEIIKGASSVLYGSSALNGVINLRTREPGPKPESMVQLYSGLYLSPRRKEIVWWTSPRWFGGISFSHARKAGNLDLVTGGNMLQNTGYRENEYQKHARLNLNIRYTSKSVKGLSYGVNTNGMLVNKSDFLLWQNADSGAYRQNLAGTSPYHGFRLTLDPYLHYHTPGGGLHILNTRYFAAANNMEDNPDKNNHFNLFLGEYRYQKEFTSRLHLTAGLSENYGVVHAGLYGSHRRNETALYSQIHGTLGTRLKYTLGGRWETYRLDSLINNAPPVFRAGINYRLLTYTHMRVSAGQGYRFPSVAEKYTSTSVGALHIFPNPSLLPERGWSAEAGIMQGFRIGLWSGYTDISLFRNEYRNMIEFTFGLYLPDSVRIPTFDYVGFKALNVGHARITGVEILTHLEKNTGNLKIQLQGGYTYLNPLDLNIQKNDSVSNILKYRFRHSVKGSADLSRKSWTTGITFVYRSFMERVDSVFTDPLFGNLLLPGYPAYRQNHHQGTWVFDYRLGCQVSSAIKLSVICKNLFNREYIGRPGDIRPPRNITLQLLLRL